MKLQESPIGVNLQLTAHRGSFMLDAQMALPGDRVSALFGPSGSGKTTCLRAIAGLEPSARGHVHVNGEIWHDDVQGIFLPAHKRSIGYVFQDARLFGHLTVAQNLAFGATRASVPEKELSIQRITEWMGLVELLPRQTRTLSGGERQRVAIARALATTPKLLLMDEALASLDAKRKAEILPFLEKLRDRFRIPMIYVSHSIDEVARLADHLVLLESGKVSGTGPTADLMTRLDLPLAHGDNAAAVVLAKVIGHEPQYHLTLAEFTGGQLNVPRQMLDIGEQLRIRIQARDVSLTLQRQSGTSILNILPVKVISVAHDSPGQVMVRLDAGGTALLARVTKKSADALGLVTLQDQGREIYAQVKGVAILG